MGTEICWMMVKKMTMISVCPHQLHYWAWRWSICMSYNSYEGETVHPAWRWVMDYLDYFEPTKGSETKCVRLKREYLAPFCHLLRTDRSIASNQSRARIDWRQADDCNLKTRRVLNCKKAQSHCSTIAISLPPTVSAATQPQSFSAANGVLRVSPSPSFFSLSSPQLLIFWESPNSLGVGFGVSSPEFLGLRGSRKSLVVALTFRVSSPELVGAALTFEVSSPQLIGFRWSPKILGFALAFGGVSGPEPLCIYEDISVLLVSSTERTSSIPVSGIGAAEAMLTSPRRTASIFQWAISCFPVKVWVEAKSSANADWR